MTNTQITNKQKVSFVLAAQTDQGVAIDTSPAPAYALESGPTDPATVVPNVSGFAGDFVSGAGVGDSVFSCSAFVAGQPVTGEITVTVTADGRIGNLVFTFSVPVDKDTPPQTAK